MKFVGPRYRVRNIIAIVLSGTIGAVCMTLALAKGGIFPWVALPFLGVMFGLFSVWANRTGGRRS
jgi:hypothetical protein